MDTTTLKTKINQSAREIVQAIILDKDGRKGFGNEWGNIAPEVRAEIRAEWRSIVNKEIARFALDLLGDVLSRSHEEPDGEASRRKREELAGVGEPPDSGGS